MKVETYEGDRERRILIAMIVNKQVLGRITNKWDERLFSNSWCNLVAGWCVEYFKKYQNSPGKSLKGIFESWLSSGRRDKPLISLVERLLVSLSEEYDSLEEEVNPSQIIDLAGEHFNKVRLARLADLIQGDIDSGKLEKAEKHISDYSRIELGTGAGSDLFIDKEAVYSAFGRDREPVIKYTQGLGKFFGYSLERSGFITFMGPEKRGKTFWLTDISWRAMVQRKRVAFFTVGDMDEAQLHMRFLVRASCHPFQSPNGAWPYIISYPTNIKPADDYGNECGLVTYDEKVFKKPLSKVKAWSSCEKVMKTQVKSKKSFFRSSCHPNSTINVSGIKDILQSWERVDGWIPDVIVIDYADILGPPTGSGRMDIRDQINTTWKQLRALSQSQHCLVVTATQTDAKSYEKGLMTMENFSEDKRKFSHVTGAIGINQTHDEKSAGITRLNWLVLRENDYSLTRCCHIAGCLGLGNPAILSVF